MMNLSSSAAVVSSEFIFENAPFPSCHASTIVETPGGLVAAWFGGTRERHPDVGIWLSHREAAGWSAPREIVNGTVEAENRRYPCWNPVLFYPREGPLHLYYKVGPSPSTWWGMLVLSHDHGRTWGEPKRLPDDIYGPIRNKPVQFDDGTILCGSSTENAGWQVHMELTQTLGERWTRIKPLNNAMEFGAIQPTLLRYGSSNILQALCRSKQRRVTECRSNDGGLTWTPMKRTLLPNPNSAIDGVVLNDLRALLVYNHAASGRGLLNVALSANLGEDWAAALVLENEPGSEFSYPAVIQTADGLVHITYTWKRRRIKHVVVDPTKLVSRPLRDGQWPHE